MNSLSKSLNGFKNWLFSSDYKPVLSKKKYEELEDRVRLLESNYKDFEVHGYQSSDVISQLGHLINKQDYARNVDANIEREIDLSVKSEQGVTSHLFVVLASAAASIALYFVAGPFVGFSAAILSSVCIAKSHSYYFAKRGRAKEQTKGLIERVEAVRIKIAEKEMLVLSGIQMPTVESLFKKDGRIKWAFYDAVLHVASESCRAAPQPKPQANTP
jgi:hypothetical protein